MSSLQLILADLLRFPSLTPSDAGCQDYMIDYLEEKGFRCQRLDNPPVSNFYAQFGSGSPLLVFAGHTDVVPAGDRNKWKTDPFTLHEEGGILYGRGVADMKGSLASMLIAATRFTDHYPQFSGSLGFLITSGEEGDDYDYGTPYIMEQLQQQNIMPDFCILGEPSSSHHLGDTIKIGRRGSLSAKVVLHGKQGHVAYPHLAENPIHKISLALSELTAISWDEGNLHFPPTSMQITHIQSGGQAVNIIPGELTMHLNFRYSTEQTHETIKETVETCFLRHGLSPLLEWRLSGEPFLTSRGQLIESCIKAIRKHTGKEPALSTSGGTSDGRFIAPYGVELIELGPVNATIHQVNECVALADLETLADIYYTVCEDILINNQSQV